MKQVTRFKERKMGIVTEKKKMRSKREMRNKITCIMRSIRVRIRIGIWIVSEIILLGV